MGNYKLYFALSALFALMLLTIIAMAIIHQGSGWLIFVGLIQIPLGFMQLYAGVDLWVKRKNYPEALGKGIRAYWLMNLVYFLVLGLIFTISRDFWPLVAAWLFVIPWIIAAFQFNLVWRMAGLRKRQLEKRELVQFYNH